MEEASLLQERGVALAGVLQGRHPTGADLVRSPWLRSGTLMLSRESIYRERYPVREKDRKDVYNLESLCLNRKLN